LQATQGTTDVASLISLSAISNVANGHSINPAVPLTSALVNTALTEIGAKTNTPIRYLVANDFQADPRSSATILANNTAHPADRVDFLNFTANDNIKGDYLDLAGFKGIALVSGPVSVGNIHPGTEVIDGGNGASFSLSNDGGSIIIAQGGSSISGGTGLDKVILPQTNSTAARVSIIEGTVNDNLRLKLQIDMPGQAPTTLSGVERIQFADKVLALDTGGTSEVAQAYRLYSLLGHDRTPDQDGLGYWVHQLDNKTTPNGIRDVARAFLQSTEFKNNYGAVDPIGPVNSAFLTMLYQNILGRAPDPAGLQFWLNSGQTAADIVMYFINSPENVTITGAALAHGVLYTLYHP
jgi:hypothetical protein